MKGRFVGLWVMAVLIAGGCDRSPAGLESTSTAPSGELGLAGDPNLPWLELTGLRFQGTEESSQTTYDLMFEGIAARYWPHPDFAPGPAWASETQWLQFVERPGSVSEGSPNPIDGAGRIQQTPAGIFGLGTIMVGVSGIYTTANGSERITGVLRFDLAEGLIVPVKGESFFEPCGMSCIDFGAEARFDPDPIFNLPPGIGLFGEVIGRLTGPLVAISAGGSHTCGLFVAGAAYCWGANNVGQLGDGSNDHRDTPVPVSGGLAFTALSAGGAHTCGLTAGGQAYCWGINNFGQLGDGTNAHRNHPGMVAGAHVFTAISAGLDHTCGLTASGGAYCWGGNEFGLLGNGSNVDSSIAVAVAGGHMFTAISAGYEHTCALDSTGGAYCWGGNRFLQLGIGPDDLVSHRTDPQEVLGGLTFTDISAGGDHTCAVTPARDAYCWGLGDLGQLGNGANARQGMPVLVRGGHAFTDISAGTDHTCAVAFGSPYCWGYNFFGQLGNGSNTDQNLPVVVSGGRSFHLISAGGTHACGLTTAGTAYCWGRNMEGALGDGTRIDSNVPVPVDFF